MFDIGAISGKIVLDKTQWDASMTSIKRDMLGTSQKTKQLADDLKTMSSQLGKFGSKLIFLGGAMFLPFALAIRSAAKDNYAFEMRLNSLGDSFKEIQADIANEMIPYLNDLVKTVGNLTTKFKELDPHMKTATVNFMVVSGLILLSTGTILKFVSAIGILISGLIRVGGFLMTLIPLMAIFSTFRLMGLTADVAVLAKNVGILYPVLLVAGSALAGWKLGETIGKVTGLNEALSGENGLFTKMFMWLDEKGISEKWDKFLGLFNKGAKKNPIVKVEFDGITPGNGLRTSYFDGMIQKMSEFNSGFQRGMKNASLQLNNFGKFGEVIAERTATAMGTFFSDLFFNVLTLQFDDLKQVVAGFGNFILRILSDIISQIVTAKIVAGIVQTFPSLAAKAPVAAPALAEGTNLVPYTGLYKLHAGEEVKPARYVNDSQVIELTIQNAITNEAIAMAMQSREGAGVIVNTINVDSLRNGITRREVVRR